MKVRWSMVTPIHIDRDPKELTYSRHAAVPSMAEPRRRGFTNLGSGHLAREAGVRDRLPPTWSAAVPGRSPDPYSDVGRSPFQITFRGS
jgi:hypothetical protein